MKKYTYYFENADFELMIYVIADSSEEAIKYREAIVGKFLETPAERSIYIGEKYGDGSSLTMRKWAIHNIKNAKPTISYQELINHNDCKMWGLMLHETNVMLVYNNKNISKLTDVFCLHKDHIDRAHIYSFWKKSEWDTAEPSAASSNQKTSVI